MDTVSGASMNKLNRVLSQTPVGPSNMAVYMRRLPKSMRKRIDDIQNGIVSHGSMYDGTCDAAVGVPTNTSYRMLDDDVMMCEGISVLGGISNIYIQDVISAPGYVQVYCKGSSTSGDQVESHKRMYQPSIGPMSFQLTKECYEVGDGILKRKSDKYAAALSYIHETSSEQTSFDAVHCFASLGWPDIARPWIYRCRHWPPTATVLRCAVSGFHLVPKAHPGGDTSQEWRYSFSLAECLLLDAMSDVQWKCYYMCKTLLHTYLNIVSGFSTYHLKTLMFWACEEHCNEHWSHDNLSSAILGVIDNLIHAYTEGCIPHYFIEKCNLLENTNHFSYLDALRLLINARKDIVKMNFKPDFVNRKFWSCQYERFGTIMQQLLRNRSKEWRDLYSTTQGRISPLEELTVHLIRLIEGIQKLEEALDKSSSAPGDWVVKVGIVSLGNIIYMIGLAMIKHFTNLCETTGIAFDPTCSGILTENPVQKFVEKVSSQVNHICSSIANQETLISLVALILQDRKKALLMLNKEDGIIDCNLIETCANTDYYSFSELLQASVNLLDIAQVIKNETTVKLFRYHQGMERLADDKFLRMSLQMLSNNVSEFLTNQGLTTTEMWHTYKNNKDNMYCCIKIKKDEEKSEHDEVQNQRRKDAILEVMPFSGADDLMQLFGFILIFVEYMELNENTPEVRFNLAMTSTK